MANIDDIRSVSEGLDELRRIWYELRDEKAQEIDPMAKIMIDRRMKGITAFALMIKDVWGVR